MSAALFDINGKVACVTGASSGLGRAAANILAAAGVKVVGIARREDALAEWQNMAQGETAVVVADLSDRAVLGDTARQAALPFGPPDILINAAGINTAGINTRQNADDVTAEGWDTTLNLNLSAPFFLAQAMVPAMKAKGWGRIINFASLQSQRAFENGISYGASKGGVM